MQLKKSNTYTSEELTFKPNDCKPISKESINKTREIILAYAVLDWWESHCNEFITTPDFVIFARELVNG